MTQQMTATLRRAFSWRLWLRGLVGAIIGALGNAVTLMVTDPATYNIFADGNGRKLAEFCIGSAMVSAALYIKTHPITAPLPEFATSDADSAERGEEAGAELGTNPGRGAPRNGARC